MGNFLDELQKRNEERRIAGLKREIRSLEAEIETYEAAREKVRSAKNNCHAETDRWQETVGKLEQKEVRQAGIFEGEMANALETYIHDAGEENRTAITEAATLIMDLGRQIDKINDKISSLNSSISYKRSLI